MNDHIHEQVSSRKLVEFHQPIVAHTFLHVLTRLIGHANEMPGDKIIKKCQAINLLLNTTTGRRGFGST